MPPAFSETVSMDLTEAYILDAGWLFFAAWSLLLLAVGAIAFGRDLLPPLLSRPTPTPPARSWKNGCSAPRHPPQLPTAL